MPEITQMIIALALSFLLDRFLKPYLLRKWPNRGLCCPRIRTIRHLLLPGSCVLGQSESPMSAAIEQWTR